MTIDLQPIAPVTPPPSPSTPWSLGQVLHDSWSAALGFAQALATLLTWLLVFSIYLVPVALVGWFIWHRIHSRQALTSPAIDSGSSQTEPWASRVRVQVKCRGARINMLFALLLIQISQTIQQYAINFAELYLRAGKNWPFVWSFEV